MPAVIPDYAKPENNKYPGYRLGYPEDGRGAIGGFWRRIGGLFLDWFIAVGIASTFFGGDSGQWSLPAGFIFFGLTSLSIVLVGGSIGHLVFGLHLSRLDGSTPGLWRPVLRQTLLMLVLPALVWDTDRRGGHDIISGLALRLRR